MDFLERYEQWLSASELTDDERARLSAMTDAEKKECFWAPLEFGTAGMRGVIDLGVNRMNRFTVGRATKGLADYICSLGEDAKKRGVVIARDTRRKSDEFAVLTAKILAANGIRAYLFEDVRPVPMCSFAIRHLKAEATAIRSTARTERRCRPKARIKWSNLSKEPLILVLKRLMPRSLPRVSRGWTALRSRLLSPS